MAASGSTTIQLYNSSTASAVPTSGNLVQGELGINVTDKKIYTKNASAAVVVVGFGPDASVALTALTGLTVSSGGASITGNTSVTGTLGVSSTLSTTSGSAVRLYRPDNAIYTDISMAAAASGGLIFNNANSDGFTFKNTGVDIAKFDSSGNLQVMGYGNLSVGGNMLTIAQDKELTVAPSGSYFFNIEALSGLGTAGLLIIRGNENGLNQTVAVYTYNLGYYVYTNTRYARLTQISRNTLNSGYGDVYPYFSNYSGSYTSTDQSISGTSTSTSDVYFRNAVGAGFYANFSIIRIN